MKWGGLAVLLFGDLFYLQHFTWFANAAAVMVFCNYGVFCDNLI